MVSCGTKMESESTILVYILVDFNLDSLGLEATPILQRRSYYG